MSEIKVTINGENFICNSFYDTDTSTNGIDVMTTEQKHLGEMWGEEIPIEEDNEFFKDEMEGFLKRVEEWLTEYYSNIFN